MPSAPRRRWRRRSVRLRLTAWYAALFLVGGAALLTTSYFVVRSQFLSPEDHFTVPVGSPNQPGAPKAPPNDRVYVTPPLADTIEENPTDDQIARAQQELAEINREALGDTLVFFVIALGATTVASLGLAWVLAGRALRPVARITATARRVSEESLHQRIALAGPDDELKELADTFDEMLAKLDKAFESQRGFVASAAHELRTPLAVMRTAIDVTLEEEPVHPERLRSMAETLRGAIDRSERLFERLLTLASGDRGLEHHEPVELASLCRDTYAELAPRALERGLDVALALEPTTVRGDRVLITHLVANLVENAIRHNRDGGRLDLACRPAAGHGRLVVANDGAPIHPDELHDLRTPFRRLRREREAGVEGFGLGLAIVDSVTRAHAGELCLHARESGGLEVTVTLPIWSSSHRTERGSRNGGVEGAGAPRDREWAKRE